MWFHMQPEKNIPVYILHIGIENHNYWTTIGMPRAWDNYVVPCNTTEVLGPVKETERSEHATLHIESFSLPFPLSTSTKKKKRLPNHSKYLTFYDENVAFTCILLLY